MSGWRRITENRAISFDARFCLTVKRITLGSAYGMMRSHGVEEKLAHRLQRKVSTEKNIICSRENYATFSFLLISFVLQYREHINT